MRGAIALILDSPLVPSHLVSVSDERCPFLTQVLGGERLRAGTTARSRRARPTLTATLAVAAAASQVALKLARDRLAASLGQFSGVLGLLEVAHVVGDLGIILGEFVDP